MEQENQQHIVMDEALVPITDQVKISARNMSIDLLKKQKESTYQLTLDIFKQYSFYNAFLKTANIDSRHTSAKRKEQMPYPRFTKVIINHFLTKHNTLPKRQTSFIHTIKYDSVLRNMKFMSKGEEHQKYGMSIPDSIMNDAIRRSKPYLTYLTMSTNTEVPKVGKGKGKGKGKGPKGKKKAITPLPKEKKRKNAPRKKSYIIADDNILQDPDEALKLGKSISLIETEEQEEERRLHETHVRLITKKIPYESVEEALDHFKKNKGIETLSATAQLILDIKTATKAKVPDKPKDNSGSSSSLLSRTNDETKDIFSDKEKDDKKMKDTENEESTKAEEEHAVTIHIF
ncbi:hypothetical protein Tco_1202112 [Tanacetum coccineum]